MRGDGNDVGARCVVGKACVKICAIREIAAWLDPRGIRETVKIRVMEELSPVQICVLGNDCAGRSVDMRCRVMQSPTCSEVGVKPIEDWPSAGCILNYDWESR